MAEHTSDVSTTVRSSAPVRSGSVSKLALLASFVAGAFAAWLLIELNSEDVVVNNAPPAMSMQAR
jgi:hypothetical protein